MTTKRTAIITGVTGMDGKYLAKLLLSKDYKVYGMVRRASNYDMSFIKELGLEEMELVEADLSDSASLYKLISSTKPDEFYNLAAQSFVGSSFTQPEYTCDVTGLGVVRILEAIRHHSPNTRFYQASTSELYGNADEVPQSEDTVFKPQSPYAAAKLLAHHMVRIYRDGYNLHASCGILFNHEGIYRSKQFVTRKITSWVGEYANGVAECPLHLGNLDALRDWGHAEDYVEAMWLMLQRDVSDDYVIGTGECYSVRDFCNYALREIGIDLVWEGEGINEIGLDSATGKVLIRIDPKFYRPCEVNILKADAEKAYNILGWRPKTSFPELVKLMVATDIERARNDNTSNSSHHSKKVETIS